MNGIAQRFRQVSATLIAGAAVVMGTYGIQQGFNVDIPAEVGAAATVLISTLLFVLLAAGADVEHKSES